MLNLVSAHIRHMILYSHNDCILQDFNVIVNVSTEDLKRVWEMLCEYILKETIDRQLL
jgi:hypothetical protein